MEKRIRSPNYPAMSLPDAIQRVAQVHKNQHTHGAPREVVAKSMGYNSLNGASATAVSALIKYGLLDGRADDIRVSERAMRILHPASREERFKALQEAAADPQLFQELDQKFPGRVPSEDVLRNHLIRTGFSPSAVSSVVLAYRETKDFVERESGGYIAGVDADQEPPTMSSSVTSSAQDHRVVPSQPVVIEAGSRLIGRWDFEDGGSVRIVADGDVDTAEALDMVSTIVELKRAEIARRKAVFSNAPSPANDIRIPDDRDA